MNPKLLIEYDDEKANLLFKNHFDNDKQLKTKIDIINEFKEIYQYDLKTAEIPKLVGEFDNKIEKENFKQKKLFEFDFYMILGNIFGGYIENLVRNRINPYRVDVPSTIVNYNELYDLSVANLFTNIENEIIQEQFRGTRYEFLIPQEFEYAEELNEYGQPLKIVRLPSNNIIPLYNNHAYLASYVFPTLIEYFLGVHLRSRLLYKSIEELGKIKENMGLILSNKEEWLYQKFSTKGNKTLTRNVKDTMKDIYNMLVKYNIFKENEDYEMILVGEAKTKNKGKKITRTIGSILNSSYANKVIIPEYMEMIRWLFDSRYLNIRNNIMHGNNANFDYFAICFPCIMLELIWDIGKDNIFHKNSNE